MLEWFVRTGTRQLGPVSERSLRAMAERGALEPDATVWRPGMSEWVAASELLSAEAAPSATASAASSPELGAMLGVHLGVSPWARLWARGLDLLLWVSVGGLLVGGVAPSLFLEDGLFTGRWGTRLLGWLLSPAALLLDALIYALFGTTPGKALAGLKVRDHRGARLSFWAYLRRNFLMFWYGRGLDIPIVVLVTLYGSYQKVGHGEVLAWDRAAGSQVRSAGSGRFRTTGVALLYLAFVAVASASSIDELDNAVQRISNGAAGSAPAQLRAAAEAVRKASPRFIDAGTRLDGADEGPGLNFTYNYTLLDLTDSEVDTPALHDALYAVLKPQACTAAEFKSFRDLECTVHFSYSDKHGVHITTVSVTPYDCGSAK